MVFVFGCPGRNDGSIYVYSICHNISSNSEINISIWRKADRPLVCTKR